MSSLTQATSGQRAHLMTHVDRLPGLADAVETGTADVASRLTEEHAYLVSTLLPLMETVEARVYPELDRLLSCRLAMTPMEREHAEVRTLIARLGMLDAASGSARDRQLVATLRRLHAVLASHLSEESSYARVLEHHLDPAAAEILGGTLETIRSS